MTTFSYTASYGAAVTEQPNVRSIKFGDGYEQRATFGINNRPRRWDLQFRSRDNTDANAIIAFFQDANGVDYFNWTPPYGSAGKWLCRSWNRTVVSNGISDITATFEEVFDL